jgi:LysM repeat protein
MKRIFCLFAFVLLASVYLPAQNESPEIQISSEKIMLNGEKFYLHQVKKGQTLYSISKAYRVTEKELMVHNPELSEGLKAGQTLKIPVKPLKAEQQTPVVDTSEYHIVRIRRKHTLYSLSKRYDVSIQEIYDANPGLEDKGLRRKDTIIIPRHALQTDKVDFSDPEFRMDSSKYLYHTVKPKETLYSLSKKYNVKMDLITDENPELKKRDIWVGEVIKIPRKKIRFVATFPEADGNVKANVQRDTAFFPDSIRIQPPDSLLSAFDDSIDIPGFDELDILVILPFNAKENIAFVEKLEKDNKRPALHNGAVSMIRFYQGLLMGLDTLDIEDRKIRLHVYDNNGSPETTSEILANLDFDPNLIIGPVKHACIKPALEFADALNISLLASVDPQQEDFFSHKSLISIKPSSEVQYNFMASYAFQSGLPVVLVHDGSKRDSARAKHVQSVFETYFNQRGQLGFLNIRTNSFKRGEHEQLHKLMDEKDTTLVVSVSSGRIFINALMNALFQCKDKHIRLVGSEEWLDQEYVSLESYQKAHFTYITPQYINYSDSTSFEIIRKYRDVFNDEPEKYAFIGLDVANMLIPVVLNHGTSLKEALTRSGLIEGLSMDWRFLYAHSDRALINLQLKLIELKQDYSFGVLFESDSIDLKPGK